MKQHLAVAVAIVLTLGHAGSVFASSTVADTATTANTVDPRYQFLRQQLANAHAMARNDNFVNADRAFSQVIGDPLFASLSQADQRTALSTAGWMAVKLDQLTRARDLYRRAAAYDDADPDDWYRLSLLELDEGRYESSSAAFVELAERWPQLLPNVDESHIHRLLRQLPSDSPARVALAQSLFDANWTSKTGADSRVWYELASARVDRGDMGSALAAMRRIDSPYDLIRLRSDKRFDALVDADSWTFDVENAARKQVEELQHQADLATNDLEIRTQLSYALLMAGMHDEVISLADRILAAIANAPADEPAFTDIGDQVWLMNNRAIALRRLGRNDEALAELVRASQLTEGGQVNVSQALNLGVFYCSLRRPDDALQAIAPVGQMSGYGRMVQSGVLHCAALQKGDKRGASQALAYLRKHRTDGPVAYLEALLRAGQLDKAASYVSELLTEPGNRGDILEWLQDGLRPAALPGDAQARAARDTLLARQDVLEAVAEVGRIERYGIYLINTVD